MKNLLRDFNAKVGREDIFKPTENESLHEISNDNEVRVVNFATSKNLILKSTTFPYCNIRNNAHISYGDMKPEGISEIKRGNI
jgi:hypothetical protein